ncbi:MAG: inner membrane CreD family protein [Bacteroidetes bacterium]|nr:inner membrane CreD family protein [Bacteroidota bacterium]
MPEKLERSIYEVTVYDAQMQVDGNFDLALLQQASFTAHRNGKKHTCRLELAI